MLDVIQNKYIANYNAYTNTVSAIIQIMLYKRSYLGLLFTRLWLISILSTFIACNSKPAENDTAKLPSVGPKEYEEVSIINLIATPERYHDKRIRITGYLNLIYENDAVYLHKEDYDMAIGKNCVGLIITTEVRNSAHYQSCNNKYVFVEGTFNMDAGNLGSFTGALDSIARIGIKRTNSKITSK